MAKNRKANCRVYNLPADLQKAIKSNLIVRGYKKASHPKLLNY